MDDIKKRISDIVRDMEFDRKPRVSKTQKEACFELSDDVGGVKKELDKLNLRLWHCVYKNDYHSLKPDEALDALKKIRSDLDGIIEKNS